MPSLTQVRSTWAPVATTSRLRREPPALASTWCIPPTWYRALGRWVPQGTVASSSSVPRRHQLPRHPGYAGSHPHWYLPGASPQPGSGSVEGGYWVMLDMPLDQNTHAENTLLSRFLVEFHPKFQISLTIPPM